MKVTNTDALGILSSAEFCNVASVCDDGTPWNTPVFFVADNNQNIYWWSSRNAVHSKNILRDGHVYITVLDPKATQNDGLAVYIKGIAHALDNPADIMETTTLYNKRSVFVKLTNDICSGEAPTRIFKAQPTNIWLNAGAQEGKYYIDVRKKVA